MIQQQGIQTRVGQACSPTWEGDKASRETTVCAGEQLAKKRNNKRETDPPKRRVTRAGPPANYNIEASKSLQFKREKTSPGRMVLKPMMIKRVGLQTPPPEKCPPILQEKEVLELL